MSITKENHQVINRLTKPLVSLPLLWILGIQSGYAIAPAQPTEAPKATPVPPSVTQVLPANVTGVMLFNNQPQAWENVSRFISLPADFALPGFVPNLPSEINFAREIKPWLGDWTAQVLMANPQNSPNRPLSHRTLTLAPVTNPSRLPQFIEQVKQQRQTPPLSQEYQGIKILVWPATVISPQASRPTLRPKSAPSPASDQIFSLGLARHQEHSRSWARSSATPPQVMPGLAIAVVPGYLAAATSPEAIQHWLDSRDRGMKLADNPNFQRTLANPEFDRSFFVGYGEIAELAKSFFAQTFDPKGLPLPVPIPAPQDLQNALGLIGETYSSTEVFAWFQPEGLRVKSRIYYQNPLDTSAMNFVGDDIYAQIPAATYFSLSGNNLNQLFLGLFRELLSQPAIAEVWSTLSSSTSSLKPNLEANSIPWLDGEYAIFLFPTTGGLFPAFDPRLQLALGIIIKTRDPVAAQAALQRLDQLVVRSSEQNITLKQENINGQTLTAWQVFNPQRQAMESLFSYTWLNQQTLLLATGLAPLKELYPKPYLSLDQAFNFITATRPLPQPNHGYLYLNIGSLLSLVNNFLSPQEINNDYLLSLGTRILESIRSITLSTASTNISTQADFFIVLSPRRPIP